MASRKVLLNKLLETLVDEWGGDEVKSSLDRILSAKDNGEFVKVQKDQFKEIDKASAESQVNRLDLPDEQKRPLLELAHKFDQKVFLARTADVRHFIIMLGERPTPTKDRRDAFRLLLRHLLKVPAKRLEQIAQSASYSGLAQLGPISDAISAAGERLPRQPQGDERG